MLVAGRRLGPAGHRWQQERLEGRAATSSIRRGKKAGRGVQVRVHRGQRQAERQRFQSFRGYDRRGREVTEP